MPSAPAVLLVPGCSGFVARNGINHYDERARQSQAAGSHSSTVWASTSVSDLMLMGAHG